MKDLYDDQSTDFPFKSLSEQFAPNETYQKLEYTVTLPFDMAVEHFELAIGNTDLFGKYLKLFKVETVSSDKPLMHVRGGFYDT